MVPQKILVGDEKFWNFLKKNFIGENETRENSKTPSIKIFIGVYPSWWEIGGKVEEPLEGSIFVSEAWEEVETSCEMTLYKFGLKKFPPIPSPQAGVKKKFQDRAMFIK